MIPEDVASYTSETGEAGVELKPGKEVYHIEVDRRTAGHTEDLNSSNDQGDFYQRGISFEVRRMRQEVQTLRRRLMNRRVHVIFTDENGLTYLYLNQRLRRNAARNQYGSKNGYTFDFSGASRLPAPYVIGELLPGPDPGDTGESLPDNGGFDGGDVTPDTSGGTQGGGLDGDLGDGGGDGGGTTDPPVAPPTTDPSDITFRQPSTGGEFRILIDPCGLPYTEPVTP